MSFRQWDPPLKQMEPVQLPFGALMLASKVSSTGLPPVQCPFSLFTFISHFWLTNILFGKA
jgi:hypothetical protein